MRTFLLTAALLSYGSVQALQAWDPVTFGPTVEVLEARAASGPSSAPSNELVVLVGERDILSTYLPLRVENRTRRAVRNAEVTCASRLWFMEKTLFVDTVPRIQGPGAARLLMPAADASPRMTCDARVAHA